MLDPDTKQPRAEMKRPYMTVRRLAEQLAQAGVEAIEYENEPFDDGLAMDVLAWEPTEGATEDYILETSRPAIIWRGRRIQQAQVVVATPTSTKGPKEGAKVE
jgi:molecular chaperone GrpE (heat shock protein)